MGPLGYVFTVLVSLLLVFLLIVYYFYSKQEKLIFYPEALPKSHTFSTEVEHEEYYIKVSNSVKINGLLLKANSPKGTIFFCHGNAGSIASWSYLSKQYLDNNWNFFIWDYRGYGKSDGNIKSESVLLKDADKVYQYIQEKQPNLPVIFTGCSLGTGIAAHLASKYPSPLVLLITPYFNFKHTVDHHYPFLPTSWLLKYRLKTNEFLAKTDCPVYLVHGTNDETIPYESSVLLQKVDPERIKLITLKGGLHNNFADFTEYSKLISSILSD